MIILFNNEKIRQSEFIKKSSEKKLIHCSFFNKKKNHELQIK